MKHVQISEAALTLQLPPVETLMGCQGSILSRREKTKHAPLTQSPCTSPERQVWPFLYRSTFFFGGGCCAASPIPIAAKRLAGW